MKTKFHKISIFAVLLVVLLASCAPVAPAAPVEVTRIVEAEPVIQEVVVTATPVVVEEKPFRVAIVMPSTITDAAFSQSMYEGLLAVQAEMGEGKMEIAYSESLFKVPDAAAALRDYATQGFDLVIAHGSQYGTSLQQIAPEFPETSFAWGTSLNTFQADGINNVFAYQAEAQQGGYVLGVLAAMISSSGKMGICGPVEAGDAKLYVEGFKAGATATKPEVVNQVNYTGSFSDVSLMATCAETQITAGADVLTGSSQSVVGAIGIAKDKGAYWFGTQWDQTKLAPETVVASQIYDWSGIINDMIVSRKAGVLGGKAYTLTFKNEGLLIQYNDKVAIPDDVKAAVQAAIDGIMAGTIDPLKGPIVK
ncbi:MAG: BMP family ABC transporter substrate-binding protein [Anaerolinea sp.]|nr:BMP family ABC transporter substrate-binding protein [Anaerolinea sp.]